VYSLHNVHNVAPFAGEGSFGTVWKGLFRGTMVAVKECTALTDAMKKEGASDSSFDLASSDISSIDATTECLKEMELLRCVALMAALHAPCGVVV